MSTPSCPPFFNTFAYGQLVAYLITCCSSGGQTQLGLLAPQVLRWVQAWQSAPPRCRPRPSLANLIPWWRFSMPMLWSSSRCCSSSHRRGGAEGPWGRTAWGRWSSCRGDDGGAGDRRDDRLAPAALVLMGLQPVVAGRFYGMGNVTFAIFVTAALLLATALSSSRARPAPGWRRSSWPSSASGAVPSTARPATNADGGPPAAIPGHTSCCPSSASP